jgi:hypothetical protein
MIILKIKKKIKIDYTSKNVSQADLKLKEIKKIFFDSNSEDNEKKNNNIMHSPQLEEKQKFQKNTNKFLKEKNEDKMKKKEQHKTLKFDINFKKVWEDKKKELKKNK